MVNDRFYLMIFDSCFCFSISSIDNKSDIGDYTYHPTKKNAVVMVDNIQNLINSTTQDIEYDELHNPKSIVENGNEWHFEYDANHHRNRAQIISIGGSTTTRVYVGNSEYQYDQNGDLMFSVDYVAGGDGLCALVVKDFTPTATTNEPQVFTVYKDYLGSINLLVDESGSATAAQEFDPWGRYRDANTWTSSTTLPALPGWLWRGYTGHEHIEEFQLINMNGRLYDPYLGRMLSPDNYVQDATSTQNYNRYSYALNNPLKYTDPDGEIAFLAVVGIYAGVNLAADLIRNDFNMNIGEIGMSVGLGAVQGALAATGVGAAATGWTVLGSAVASQINIPIYQSDNFNLSVSPSLLAGTNGLRVGASLYGSARFGNTSVGFGYNLGRNFGATDLSGQMAEAKWSSITSWNVGWNDGKHGLSYGASHYGGNYAQSVGNFGFQIGRFSASIENDVLTGSGDKYRTAAVTASYQVNDDLALTAGFSIWTGAPNEQSRYTVNGADRPCYYSECEGPSALRNGNWFVGANYRGRSYLAGGNSEGVRSAIQNGWHDATGSKALRWVFGGPSPHFERMPYRSRFYSSFGTYNPFSIYRQ